MLGLVGYFCSLKRFPITDFYGKKASTYILINSFVRVISGIAMLLWFIVFKLDWISTGIKSVFDDANLLRTLTLFDAPFYLAQMSLV